MHLSGLYVYPVKSLRGTAVTTAQVDALGVVGDRRFLIVDRTGRFLTQRTLPRLARIAPQLTATDLVLASDGAGPIAVPLHASGAVSPVTVSIWRSEGLLAEDCGDDAARWLTSLLGVECRLVRAGAQFCRPILKSAARDGDVVNFADAVPFLAIGEASLADLNDRLAESGEEPVPMNRFRPNLVIAGCPAFAEDTWPRVRIGDIVLRAAGPCGRCVVTTTDQLTGERGKEPLRTLATYRRDATDPSDVNFGQNFIHETKSGCLRVGDAVVALPA